MGLADQMRPLVKQIAADHDQRVAAVSQMRAATARELSESNAARRKMAREYRKAADESLERRHSDVATLRADYRAAHRAVAAKQRKQLNAQTKTLRKDVTQFLSETAAAHGAMAAEQAERLAEQRSTLEEQMAATVQELAADREARADAQRKDLASGRAALAGSVVNERRPLQKDFAEGRRAWLSVDSLKKRGGAKPRATPAPGEASRRGGNGRPDDLTVIHGLGPTMQQRLNDAGIRTFAQLAGSSVAGLRKALGNVRGRTDVEDWIAEAHDLTR